MELSHLGGSQNISELWWRFAESRVREFALDGGQLSPNEITKPSPLTRPKTSSIGFALQMPLPYQAGRDDVALCVVL